MLDCWERCRGGGGRGGGEVEAVFGELGGVLRGCWGIEILRFWGGRYGVIGSVLGLVIWRAEVGGVWYVCLGNRLYLEQLTVVVWFIVIG